MEVQTSNAKKSNRKNRVACGMAAVLLVASGVGVGYWFGAKSNPSPATEPTGYAANPAYEYMVGSTA